MNLVYINTHDTGRLISPYGHDIPTKTLRELAEDATLFTNAYCCAPTCSPSRAAMLSGTYPHQNGMLGLAQRGFELKEPNRHLAAHLKSLGYQTAISGIQHEIGWYLDLNVEEVHRLGYSDVLTAKSTSYSREELHDWDAENAKRAVAWLDTIDRDRPFMLTYGLHSTHRPYPTQVADNIDERYVAPALFRHSDEGNRNDQARFMTSAQYADSNIRILLDALKEKEFYENTVIVYTTDHGAALPYHKCSLNDDGIGVALIIRHPEKKGCGTVVDTLVSHIDVFPTLCDLLNVPHPGYLEGCSFAPSFVDKDAATREFIFAEVNFHASYEPMRCVRDKRYKYIRYYDSSWNKTNLSNIDESYPKEFLMTHGLKDKVKYTEGFFDTYYDPNETNNLIDDVNLQEKIARFKDALAEWMDQTGDPIVKGELPFMPQYKVNTKHSEQASSLDPLDYDPRGRGI